MPWKWRSLLSQMDRFGAGPDDGHAGGGELLREIQGRLSAELHDHAVQIGLELIANIEHVFEHQRLEEQHVAGVIVGADRLWVGIDHHGSEARFAGGLRAVAIQNAALGCLNCAIQPGLLPPSVGRMLSTGSPRSRSRANIKFSVSGVTARYRYDPRDADRS